MIGRMVLFGASGDLRRPDQPPADARRCPAGRGQVDLSRNTETYASLTLQVNSPWWHGVPFTLCSGKALAADPAEIAIHFRPLPGTCPASGPASNRTS
jgi:glucose-6-phosphate 1-dehydrogenase